MMPMLLMECLLSGAGQDAMPTPSLFTAVSSTPSNDAMDGYQFPMWFWTLPSNPDVEFFFARTPLTMPLA
jgi:hypothetical protein